MSSPSDTDIKVPSLIHVFIVWFAALVIGCRLWYALLHQEEFSPSRLSEILGLAIFSVSYGFILCYFAISKLLKAQYVLLQERSFFKNRRIISWTVFLMVVLGGASDFFQGSADCLNWGDVVGWLYTLMFLALFFCLYFGFARLGINGRWVLFFYLLIGFVQIYYDFFLWAVPDDWKLNYFNTSAFRSMFSVSLCLVFIYFARRAVLEIGEKVLVREAGGNRE